VLTANNISNKKFEVYNVATGDYITVKEIVNLVIDLMKLNDITKVTYTGGDRGWKGDVPIVRLNTNKIRNNLKWNNKYNTKEAIIKSINDMLQDLKKGNL
jgi:UDP-glucose 4-epimerase